MIVKAFRILLLICGNLFAFLFLGNILGLALGARDTWIIASLLISFFPLVLILYFEVQGVLKEFKNIEPKKK